MNLFNVTPTAKFIMKTGPWLSLVSSNRLDEARIQLGGPEYKASVYPLHRGSS